MANRTSIEWTSTVNADGSVTPGSSWNPLRARNKATGSVGWHCTKPSAGCKNCYAERMNKRLGTGLPYTIGASDQVEVYLDEKALMLPLNWKKPRNIFVCSMTDLLGEFVTDAMIDRIVAVMTLSPQHNFQIVSKRAKRIWEYWTAVRKFGGGPIDAKAAIEEVWQRPARFLPRAASVLPMNQEGRMPWPLPNVHLGVSAENQSTFDDRVSHLLATPAAVRWVSLEPLLGPIDASRELQPHYVPGKGADAPPWLDWVVVGGESGPGARPFDIAWARSIIAQCKAAGVACFVKQLGAAVTGDPSEFPSARHDDGDGHRTFRLNDSKGGDPSEWPDDLRVREYPGSLSSHWHRPHCKATNRGGTA